MADSPGPATARRPVPAERTRHFGSLFVPAALGLVLAHVALALLVFDPTPHTGGDSAGYITLARSLLERHAYLAIYDPAVPAASKYPPAFPGLLAAAMLMGVSSWVGLKLLIVAVSGAGVAFSLGWIRAWSSAAPVPAPGPGSESGSAPPPNLGSGRTRARGPGPTPGFTPATGLALCAGAVLAISPGVLELSHWVLSDVPFWAWTMLALWGFERAECRTDVEPDANGRAARWLAVALVASVLAYFTRSAGLPLLVAAAGWLALCRRWRWLAGYATVVLPLVVIWSLRGQAGGGDYIREFLLADPYRPALGRAGFAELLARLPANALEYASAHLPELLFGDAGAAEQAMSFCILGLAAGAWGLRLARIGVAELFLPLYVALLLVWPPVWSGERFLLPLLPLLLAYAGWALVRFTASQRPRAARLLAGGAVVALVLLAAPGLYADIRHGTACSYAYLDGRPYACLAPPWRDYFELAEWTAEALPEGAVVVSRKPRIFHALSGHRSLIYPFSRNPDEFFAAAKKVGARYLLMDRVSQLTSYYVAPVLFARPRAFCVVHMLGSGRAALLGIRLPQAGSEPARRSADRRIGLPRCPEDHRRMPSR